MQNNKTNKAKKAVGLYIHIPFCAKKCSYCDFLSFEGKGGAIYREYVKALMQEFHHYGEVYNKDYYVDTIFIGGGTPSLIPQAFIEEIMAAIFAAFQVAGHAEISIETNPGTLSKVKLDTYFKAGINRLSIGAQSLDNDLLQTLGRIHTQEDIVENFLMARDCGFKNINLDLMFALPGQTLEGWRTTLEKSMALCPSHISFYSLQYEEGTPFYDHLKKGMLNEASDRLYIEMYQTALSMLEGAGYQHYEISNGALPGYLCKHNLKYWSLEDYLGLGLGAHSYMDGLRFSNTEDLGLYLSTFQPALRSEPEPAPDHNDKIGSKGRISPAVAWQHENTRQDDISEYIITGLRKINGIRLQEFEDSFGQSIFDLYDKEIQGYLDRELLTVADGQLRLTLNGIFISNSILADFV